MKAPLWLESGWSDPVSVMCAPDGHGGTALGRVRGPAGAVLAGHTVRVCVAAAQEPRRSALQLRAFPFPRTGLDPVRCAAQTWFTCPLPGCRHPAARPELLPRLPTLTGREGQAGSRPAAVLPGQAGTVGIFEHISLFKKTKELVGFQLRLGEAMEPGAPVQSTQPGLSSWECITFSKGAESLQEGAFNLPQGGSTDVR